MTDKPKNNRDEKPAVPDDDVWTPPKPKGPAPSTGPVVWPEVSQGSQHWS